MNILIGWGMISASAAMLSTTLQLEPETDPILSIGCEEAVSGSFGDAQLYATLTPEGRVSHYTLVWEMQPRHWGVWLTGTWALGRSPDAPRDNGRISIYFATGEKDVGRVRVELWPGAERPDGDMAFSSNYMAVYRNRPGAPFARSSSTRWGEIRALLGMSGEARVVLTQDGQWWTMAQDRLDAAVLDMPAAAVAAARDRLAARVADYRNQCRPHRSSDVIR